MCESNNSSLDKTRSIDRNLRIYVLAFLAERSPRHFQLSAIASRIQMSNLIDCPVKDEEVEARLRELATHGGLVDIYINPISKEPFWYATDQGIKTWILCGRIRVG